MPCAAGPPMAPESTTARTLRDVLRATPRLAPERAVALLGGIARALRSRSATHGGVTPERVLLGAGDAVSLAPPPHADGTPPPWPTYLAPEQIDGRTGDARSDVYALGLVGWEMLAGRQPWEGDSLYGIVVKQREQDLPRLSTLRPGLPRGLVQAIEGALHKAPGDRWHSADEFLGVLAPGEIREPTTRDAAPIEPRAALPARATPPDIIPRPSHPAPAVRDAGSHAPSSAVDEHSTPRGTALRPAAPARRRWLTLAALTLAALAATISAYAVVRGKQDSSATRVWLDSVTASGAGGAAAATAATTRENTTSVPIHRTGGRNVRPDDGPLEPDTADAPAPPDEPVLEPTPPFVPGQVPRPVRPLRPTVPRDTLVRRDTVTEPDSAVTR